MLELYLFWRVSPSSFILSKTRRGTGGVRTRHDTAAHSRHLLRRSHDPRASADSAHALRSGPATAGAAPSATRSTLSLTSQSSPSRCPSQPQTLAQFSAFWLIVTRDSSVFSSTRVHICPHVCVSAQPHRYSEYLRNLTSQPHIETGSPSTRLTVPVGRTHSRSRASEITPPATR